MHVWELFIFMHKYESTVYILILCPLCPSPCPPRGHLPLQGLWNLVSEREEPTGPSDVLLQWATEGARDGRRGKRHWSPSDPQYLPFPTVQQDLLRSQGPGNALEHLSQWWVTMSWIKEFARKLQIFNLLHITATGNGYFQSFFAKKGGQKCCFRKKWHGDGVLNRVGKMTVISF